MIAEKGDHLLCLGVTYVDLPDIPDIVHLDELQQRRASLLLYATVAAVFAHTLDDDLDPSRLGDLLLVLGVCNRFRQPHTSLPLYAFTVWDRGHCLDDGVEAPPDSFHQPHTLLQKLHITIVSTHTSHDSLHPAILDNLCYNLSPNIGMTGESQQDRTASLLHGHAALVLEHTLDGGLDPTTKVVGKIHIKLVEPQQQAQAFLLYVYTVLVLVHTLDDDVNPTILNDNLHIFEQFFRTTFGEVHQHLQSFPLHVNTA